VIPKFEHRTKIPRNLGSQCEAVIAVLQGLMILSGTSEGCLTGI